MLGPMDPIMNMPASHGVYIILEGRQPLKLVWCSVPSAVTEELECAKEELLAGGQGSLPLRGCEEWRGLSNPWGRILLGNRRGPYSGVEDTGETKLKGGIIAYLEGLSALQCWEWIGRIKTLAKVTWRKPWSNPGPDMGTLARRGGWVDSTS